MATDDVFDEQITRTLEFEGGYSNNPNDPGGETNFGISSASYPNVNIANLTRAEAIAIYKRDYWDATGMVYLPDQVAAKCFDLGVNMGPRTATRLLQRACNAFVTHRPIAVDGALGPQTRAAVQSINADLLLSALRTEAKNHYVELASEHPGLRVFLRGWLRRAAA